jgi:hypothetical protein
MDCMCYAKNHWRLQWKRRSKWLKPADVRHYPSGRWNGSASELECMSVKKTGGNRRFVHISKFDIEEGWEFNCRCAPDIFQGKKFGGVLCRIPVPICLISYYGFWTVKRSGSKLQGMITWGGTMQTQWWRCRSRPLLNESTEN